MLPSVDMMQTCAPSVHPTTLTAIIRVESGGNPFAIGVNAPIKNRPHPRNAIDAARFARFYISRGYSVDLGLMQINSHNLPGLGLTIEQVLEPCNNLRAGSRILSRGYRGAVKRYGEGQDALKAALSAYNTGNYERGFRNGYVAKYYRPAYRVLVQAPSPFYSARSASPTDKMQNRSVFTADSTVFSMWNDLDTNQTAEKK